MKLHHMLFFPMLNKPSLNVTTLIAVFLHEYKKAHSLIFACFSDAQYRTCMHTCIRELSLVQNALYDCFFAVVSHTHIHKSQNSLSLLQNALRDCLFFFFFCISHYSLLILIMFLPNKVFSSNPKHSLSPLSKYSHTFPFKVTLT